MHFDVLLRGGKIIDGKGNPWFKGDIGIRNGRIESIAPVIEGDASETLDVGRYFLCPGFIDTHTHSDYVFFIDSTVQSKVRQGVTTEVVGNCGISAAPYMGGAKERFLPAPAGFVPPWESIQEYLDALHRQPKTVNIAPLVGHGTLRSAVVGPENREATPAELARMKEYLSGGLAAGAFGMSLGLYFAPGAFATPGELIELARLAGRHGTVVAAHIRDEGSRSVGFISAVKEIIRLGAEAEVPVHISHIKSFGPDTWHTSGQVLDVIDAARTEGIDVTCDQYPYDTTGGALAADTLPYAFQSGKAPEQVSEELKSPSTRATIKAEVTSNITKRGGPNALTISTYPFNPSLEGRTLQELCNEQKKDPADVVMEMLGDSYEALWNCRSLNQEDVDAFMRYPATMIGSDGSSLSTEGPLSGGNPHPREFGAFPRVLCEYVRRRGVLRLEDAVRKMTSLPAQRFSVRDRGTLDEGKWADIVLFDLDAVQDATFDKPKQYPSGIPFVMVNGAWVIRNGEFTGNLPGRLAQRK
jgi:N-acyl-D-amino-acid deacylase